jgi:hypothetical protein
MLTAHLIANRVYRTCKTRSSFKLLLSFEECSGSSCIFHHLVYDGSRSSWEGWELCNIHFCACAKRDPERNEGGLWPGFPATTCDEGDLSEALQQRN